jgi:hypothetical protein
MLVLVAECEGTAIFRLAFIPLIFFHSLWLSLSIHNPLNKFWLTKWNVFEAFRNAREQTVKSHWSWNSDSCQYLLLDSTLCCWTYLSGLLGGNETCCSLPYGASRLMEISANIWNWQWKQAVDVALLDVPCRQLLLSNSWFLVCLRTASIQLQVYCFSTYQTPG